jgi:hypothetical protein
MQRLKSKSLYQEVNECNYVSEVPISEKPHVIFTSEYIAPWALPKEEIPVHLVWLPEAKFDIIELLLEPELSVKEFYNVKSVEQKNSAFVIKELFSPNFFGFVTILNAALQKQHEIRKIIIRFKVNDKIVHERIFVANIYRPQLSIMVKPDIVQLDDNSNTKELVSIALKISGFGRIEISPEFSLGGKFESNVEPLFEEMTRRLAATFKNEDSQSQKKKQIEINPQFVKQTTELFIDSIKKGNLPLKITSENLEDFKKWISDESNHERIVKLICEQLENIIMDSLLYYFNKYPTEGVSMNGGRPSVIINNAVRNLQLRFRYRDSLHNDYEPLSFEIAIKDLRTDKNKEIKLPINIKWVHEQINPLNQGEVC